MKMMMRPQKTQLPDTYAFEKGSYQFNKALHIIAGYRNFTVMGVGAGGGPSGQSGGKANSGKTITSYPAGGGGGGSFKFDGQLFNYLQDLIPIVVGAKGSAGTNHTIASTGRAGNGTNGGDTSFSANIAYGGKGAEGGYTRPGGAQAAAFPGEGGGTNGGGTPGYIMDDEDGTADITGSGFFAGGGSGGYGRSVYEDGNSAPTKGGTGASNVPDNLAAGQLPGTNTGGGGGGARLKIGETDLLWRGQSGLDSPYGDGGLLLKLS